LLERVSMSEVRLVGISKRYEGVTTKRPAVQNVDLTIPSGELVVLVGPSGCGKSTTLRIIAGLEEPTAGRVFIGERDVTDVPPAQRDIAMVFQNYALYPHMTVFDNLAFALRMRKMPRAQIRQRVEDAAAALGIDAYLDRKPKALSGGQRQRVAIGRAVVRDPKVFLFDEPLSNLDAKLRGEMRQEIARIHQRSTTTAVYVTHDQVEAMTLADRIVVLHEGVIQQVGAPLDIYESPANRFVAGFFGTPAMNFLTAQISTAGSNAAAYRGDTGPFVKATGAGFELELPLSEHSSTDVVIGVRPEALSLEQRPDATEAVGAAFNTSHDDIRVKLVAVPYDAFADKITNAIPNGNGPDLVIFAHDRIGDWRSAGLIEPIEYFVDEPFADGFAYDALAAMAYDRSLYGLPLAVKSVALFYRTDMVPTPPRTTAELLEIGGALTRRGAGQFGLVYENADLYGHAAWLHGFGGQVFSDDGELAIATPEAEAAMQFARAIGGPDGIVPPETTATLIATLFNEGKAGMAITGPWFIADIRDGVPWAVTSLPIVSETGMPAAPFLGAEGVLMSSRARDKAAAFQVMAWLAGDESAIVRARRARQVVPNLAAYDDPEIGGDPVLSAFRAQLEHTVPMPATPEMRLVWTPYKTGLQRVIEQGDAPAGVLTAIEDETRSYMEGAGQ